MTTDSEGLPPGLGEELADLALSLVPRSMPTDLVALAAALNVHEVRLASLTDDGRTTWRDSRVLIELRADRPALRQRFTLAHELAHVLIAGPVAGELVRRRSRDLQPDREERLCDWIAAAVLMPRLWIRNQVAEWLDLDAVRHISGTAQVSMAAAAVRVGEVTTRDCALIRWHRSPGARWVPVGFAGVPRGILGRVEMSEQTATRMSRLDHRDHEVEVELSFRQQRMTPQRAIVSRGGDTLLMLLTSKPTPLPN